jgi:hypothetical protein
MGRCRGGAGCSSLTSDNIGQKGKSIRYGLAQRLSEHSGSKGVLHQESMVGYACRVIVKQITFIH